MSRPTDPDAEMGRIHELLGNESVWAQPPGEIEPALLAAITGEEIAVSPMQNQDRKSWWPVYAGVAAVAALVLLIIMAPFGEEPDQGVSFALTGTGSAADARAEASVGPAEAGWWIRLTVEGLDPAPEGTYYEGWLSNGRDIVSVGTFHMRDGESVVLWSGVPMTEFPELSVTRQEVSAGTRPSADVVMTGGLDP
ncbi:MAG: anti-sigma factor [Acidimicrobiia bacterium]